MGKFSQVETTSPAENEEGDLGNPCYWLHKISQDWQPDLERPTAHILCPKAAGILDGSMMATLHKLSNQPLQVLRGGAVVFLSQQRLP